jgi:hypothetical protein
MKASPQAIAAVRAFKNYFQWGSYAAHAYIANNSADKHYDALLNFARRHSSHPSFQLGR